MNYVCFLSLNVAQCFTYRKVDWCAKDGMATPEQRKGEVEFAVAV